jgi:hypothetical protein
MAALSQWPSKRPANGVMAWPQRISNTYRGVSCAMAKINVIEISILKITVSKLNLNREAQTTKYLCGFCADCVMK